MADKKSANLFEHPLAFGSFRNWLRLLWDNKDVDRQFIPRALFVTLSTFFISPLGLYESVRYGRIVRSTSIHPSPIFIIGHWRSGTTHLHLTMCQDKNLGFSSTFQTFAPSICLVSEGIVKRPLDMLGRKRHPTRVIDNIPFAMDSPGQQDLAISGMSPYSFFHMYIFPRQAIYFYEKYITHFDDLPESIRAEWNEIYLTTMRKAALKSGKERLILRNCADTARIKALLQLFPGAKFIHIYRNPYDIFRSTRNLYETILATAQLQEISPDEIETWVLRFYTQLMQKYLTDKALIPTGNLVEVKYEDLEKDPLTQLHRIYDALSLPGFGEAEPAFRAYLASIANYQKNPQEIDDNVIVKVNQHWQFALDALGYERLQPAGRSNAS